MANRTVAAGFDRDNDSEELRLDALYDYEILDSEADARFDRVAALVAELFDMPVALVSLLDEERQWFKARVGFASSETPRDWSFCDETIRDDGVLVVEDARLDPRFRERELVAGEQSIRFYAGAPLITPGGQRVGALCVMDRRPRRLEPAQVGQLAQLAATVVDLMESHRTARMLERKQRQLALIELSQMEQIRYGRIFENSLNEIYLFDADSLQIVSANRGVRENLGYEPAELARLTPVDLMPGLLRASFERSIEQLRSGRKATVAFERLHRRKDGSCYPSEVTLELDSDDDRPLIVAMVQDVTEKRAYQQELARALSLKQSILNACQEAIETYQPIRAQDGEIVDFRCLQANAAAQRLHGLAPEAVKDATLLQLWPGWRGSPLLELFGSVMASREPASMELHYADGRREGWFRVSAAATGEGDLTLEVSDVTERKQHERALQRSNEALNQFAGGVAHDLQTPIGQIAGFTALLERHLGGEIPAKAQATLGYIAQAAENMSRLVSSLLDYARLGTLTVDPRPVDLQAVLDQCLSEHADLLTADAVERAPLPEVPGSATLLKQVFQNLIGNAVKYRSDAPLRLSIRAERAGSSLRILVEDDGIGIEPRHAERIFEVFRRLHSDGSPYPGLGMGLALTKTIVEAHGGRIWLDTERRDARLRGARIVVELPAGAPRRNGDARSASVVSLASRSRGRGG